MEFGLYDDRDAGVVIDHVSGRPTHFRLTQNSHV